LIQLRIPLGTAGHQIDNCRPKNGDADIGRTSAPSRFAH
jgi:hypothetical protein